MNGNGRDKMDKRIVALGDGTYGVEVYRGLNAPGLDFYEQAKKDLGIDLKDNPNYCLCSDGVEDDYGISESIYEEIIVYRIINLSDIITRVDEPLVMPEPIASEEMEEETKGKNQDMLDKLWGNAAKRREYKDRYERFISHLVERDGYSVIEDYPEKAQDEAFLQLTEFSYRLERLSRAQNGDHSKYLEAIRLYRCTGNMPKDENGKEYTESSLIDLLMRQDEEYIATNNYAYNQHQTTHQNLKTLGKHGEKGAYYPLREIVEENEKTGRKKFNAKALALDVVSVPMNAFVFLLNHTKKPIYSFVGTAVVAPIQDLIFRSKQSAASVYKSLATHRYQARKDIFEQLMDMALVIENIEREKKGEPPLNPNTFGYALKKAFVPRFQALSRAKEGNIIIASAKAIEIEESAKDHERAKKQQQTLGIALVTRKKELMDALTELDLVWQTEKDPSKRQHIEYIQEQIRKKLKDVDLCIQANNDQPVPGVVQTDPISLSIHEEANRSNITRVVSGVATAARVGAISYLGPKISKWIQEQVGETTIKLPDKVVEERHVIPEKVEVKRSALENLSIGEAYDKSDKVIDYYAHGAGSQVAAPTRPYFRGVDFVWEGKEYSGVCLDNWGNYQYATMHLGRNPESSDKLFDVLAHVYSETTHQPMTGKDIIDQIVNSSDPETAAKKFSEGVRFWIDYDGDTSKVAEGWVEAKDMLVDFVTKTSEHVEIVKKVIEGDTVMIPLLQCRKVVDPRILSAVIALSGGEFVDLYDLLRRTRSKTEMQKQGLVGRVLKPFEKATDKPLQQRQTDNVYGFTGTRRGDYDSSYNEEDFTPDTPHKTR